MATTNVTPFEVRNRGVRKRPKGKYKADITDSSRSVLPRERPDSPETTTSSTNSSATISSFLPYPRLSYTIDAEFTAAEEVEEE
uniref:Uncharacterized protein n=1 Tax=Solanum tuberosum TaxID=4113 RepID=M1DI54_SOLTU